jgi:hypothetical protein
LNYQKQGCKLGAVDKKKKKKRKKNKQEKMKTIIKDG